MTSVRVEHDGAARWLVLDRSEALNAFDEPTLHDLGEALDGCRDEAVRVVVITGSGSAFSAGGDVRSFAQSLGGDAPGFVRELASLMHARVIVPIRRLPKPVIACINGTAAGGGLSLALACDLRIASEDARLTMAYSGIGLAADGGSSYTLPRLVGSARAAELLLFSEPIDAHRALELGMVNRVVQAAELRSATAEWATRLARRPAGSLAEIKGLLDRSWGSTLEGQLAAEVEAMARLAATADYRAAVEGFVARRSSRSKASGQ